jgi:hypothetical protein
MANGECGARGRAGEIYFLVPGKLREGAFSENTGVVVMTAFGGIKSPS